MFPLIVRIYIFRYGFNVDMIKKRNLIAVTIFLLIALVWLGFYKKDWPFSTPVVLLVLFVLLVIGFFSLISGNYLNTLMILISLMLMVYIACKDDRDLLKEIREQSKSIVLDFYKNKNRYPRLNETKSILEKSGCTKIQERIGGYESMLYTCVFKHKKIRVSFYTHENTTYEVFSFWLGKGKSSCHLNFDDNGQVNSQSCSKDSCLISLAIRG